jgi:hypothetical protein
MQDTGKFRENTKDQFYTKKIIACECIKYITDNIVNFKNYTWLEPSSGTGSFYENIPSECYKIGIDIEPKNKNIHECDYLDWEPKNEKYIVLGNPPFGRQSSLAKKFIKKSCQYADIIAFILPLSFVKPSMYSCFDKMFHNIFTRQLEEKSFILNGEEYDVPCVFQIWMKKDIPRETEKKVSPEGFKYVSKNEDYNFAIRRVGVNAGRCSLPKEELNVQTHYFIKLINDMSLENIFSKMNNHEYKKNTTGPKSISKQEVNIAFNFFVRK